MQTPWVFNEVSLDVTTSIGLTFANQPTTKETILKKADNALSQTKEDGKNTTRTLI
ncbi:diguanylate cyclase domain-containing protein [Oceanobacillus halotolerans]|uniref:diguanylate cyclase domain-containing protein n=1 Tax=Oceanobacillus halotolerans TaxID=2663380 RepID=UPI001CF77A4B|nr:diguanylate cyclase [Oceanobacillus halotolerans]